MIPHRIAVAAACFLCLAGLHAQETADLKLVKRLFAAEQKGDETVYVPKYVQDSWNPKQTAIIVCDMWDAHHCLNAVRRVEEMAPTHESGAGKGPRPGRAHHSRPVQLHGRLQGPPRPQAGPVGSEGGQLAQGHRLWCYKIPSEEKGKYPIDQTDGGEDDDPAEHAEWHAKLDEDGPQSQGPVEEADRCPQDPRSGCHQRFRRGDLEPARGARHRQRHPAGRAHEHVRAGPAVWAAADGQERQERRPDARHDRHDVQPEPLARTSAISAAPT